MFFSGKLQTCIPTKYNNIRSEYLKASKYLTGTCEWCTWGNETAPDTRSHMTGQLTYSAAPSGSPW